MTQTLETVQTPSISIRELWHFYGGPAGWQPKPGASRDEILSELAEARPDDSFVLHIPKLDIQPGQVVCLVGPSGCGKTTLLTILGLLREASYVESFSLSIPGQHDKPLRLQQGLQTVDPDLRDQLRMEHLGFALQSGALLGAVTSEGNVDLPLHASGALSSARARQARDARDRLFRRLFEQHANRVQGLYPGSLSGGQRQRVLLARAISHQPVLVFADEPTSNLDQQSALAAIRALLAMRDELAHTTVVIVTHDMTLPETFDLPVIRLRSYEHAPWFGTLSDQPDPPSDLPRHPTRPSTELILPPGVQRKRPIVEDESETERDPSEWAEGFRPDGRSLVVRDSRLPGRLLTYAGLAIRDALHERTLLVSFVLTLLCLNLPVLLLFGLRNGIVEKLTMSIRQSPTLSRLRVEPWRQSIRLTPEYAQDMSEREGIRHVSLYRSVGAKVRFRTPDDQDPLPPLDHELVTSSSPEATEIREALDLEGDLQVDNFELYLLDESDPLLETLNLPPLSGKALELVLYKEHAQKLLDYAKAYESVPPATKLEDGYFEVGIKRGDDFLWLPVRVLGYIDTEARETHQTGYIPGPLVRALEMFREGYPVSVPNDFEASKEWDAPDVFDLPGTPSRRQGTIPSYEGMVVFSTRSVNQRLLEPRVEELLRSYELELIPLERDDPRANLHGWLDRGMLDGQDPRFPEMQQIVWVQSSVRSEDGLPLPIRLSSRDREEVRNQIERQGEGRSQAFCVFYNPPVQVTLGDDEYRALGLPIERPGRLAYYVTTWTQERVEQARLFDNFFHMDLRSELWRQLGTDPFLALVPGGEPNAPLRMAEPSEPLGLTILPRRAGGDAHTYEIRTLARPQLAQDPTDPLHEWIYLPEGLVGLDRARREGQVTFDATVGAFHTVYRGQVEFRRAFVYPEDIDLIPELQERLKKDFDVHAPGIFAIRELRRNASRLDDLVNVLYVTTFVAAMITVFIVTAMSVYQRMSMIGVLRLVGLSPKAVLWVISVRNVFLMVLGLILIVGTGFLAEGAINAIVDAGTCQVRPGDYAMVVAMVLGSCIAAFVYAGLRAASFDPVKLVENLA